MPVTTGATTKIITQSRLPSSGRDLHRNAPRLSVVPSLPCLVSSAASSAALFLAYQSSSARKRSSVTRVRSASSRRCARLRPKLGQPMVGAPPRSEWQDIRGRRPARLKSAGSRSSMVGARVNGHRVSPRAAIGSPTGGPRFSPSAAVIIFTGGHVGTPVDQGSLRISQVRGITSCPQTRRFKCSRDVPGSNSRARWPQNRLRRWSSVPDDAVGLGLAAVVRIRRLGRPRPDAGQRRRRDGRGWRGRRASQRRAPNRWPSCGGARRPGA